MKSLLGIPDEALDAVMAVAYQLYQAGRYPEVDVLCRGLVAADHKYWWSYSLHAATLRRLGALARGARRGRARASSTSPVSPSSLSMRSDLRAAIAREDAGATEAAPLTAPSTSHVAA